MFISEEEKTDKRQFRRARFNEAVHFQARDAGRSGGCLSCDISETGMKINIDDFVPVHSEMILQTKLANIDTVVDLKGKVAWLQQIPYSDRYYVGVEFTNVDPVQREGIRSYLRSHRF
ncbi:MAG: PilZ domain-containing protein [Candidatus Omnitrophota bacterium]